MIHKVTAFITRDVPAGRELLLFEHPYAGIQIPAGTVEPGETPPAAARREAHEETGLTDFTGCESLGFRDETLPPDQRVVVAATPVYARPDRASFDWARLPRGIMVQVERQSGDFIQITYREDDRLDDPQYVSYQITGWVPAPALTDVRRRHFFHLSVANTGQAGWWVETDSHRWRLFWAPVTNLPPLVAPQAPWLEMFTHRGQQEWGQEDADKGD